MWTVKLAEPNWGQSASLHRFSLAFLGSGTQRLWKLGSEARLTTTWTYLRSNVRWPVLIPTMSLCPAEGWCLRAAQWKLDGLDGDYMYGFIRAIRRLFLFCFWERVLLWGSSYPWIHSPWACQVAGITGMHRCKGLYYYHSRSETAPSNMAPCKNIIIRDFAKAFNILQRSILV